MKSALNSDLIYEVLSVVEEIPEGRVAKSIGKADDRCVRNDYR